jgi:transposase
VTRARAAKEVRSVVLVELGLVEQRHKAVLEVLDGAQITDVAVLYGVSRKTVHKWLRRYAAEGLRGLADRSSRPESCPHQMAAVVEARVVEMRREHPGWGPRTIRTRLGREGVAPLPGRSSIHRALSRHGLIDASTRKRRRSAREQRAVPSGPKRRSRPRHATGLMVRCSGCGQAVSEWAPRCPNCLRSTQDAEALPPANRPIPPGPYFPPAENVLPKQATAARSPSSRRARLGAVAATAATAAALACAGWPSTTHRPPPSPQPTQAATIAPAVVAPVFAFDRPLGTSDRHRWLPPLGRARQYGLL